MLSALLLNAEDLQTIPAESFNRIMIADKIDSTAVLCNIERRPGMPVNSIGPAIPPKPPVEKTIIVLHFDLNQWKQTQTIRAKYVGERKYYGTLYQTYDCGTPATNAPTAKLQ